MTFCLVWNHEIIEKEIEGLDEAEYLKSEYQLAFNDTNITIIKELPTWD